MTNDYQLNRSNLTKILIDHSYTPKISLFKYIYVYICIFRAPRARASSSGGNGVNTQVSGADGIYLNETFMHRVTSLIGLEVEVRIFNTLILMLCI